VSKQCSAVHGVVLVERLSSISSQVLLQRVQVRTGPLCWLCPSTLQDDRRQKTFSWRLHAASGRPHDPHVYTKDVKKRFNVYF